jgi:hypothetical protein
MLQQLVKVHASIFIKVPKVCVLVKAPSFTACAHSLAVLFPSTEVCFPRIHSHSGLSRIWTAWHFRQVITSTRRVLNCEDFINTRSLDRGLLARRVGRSLHSPLYLLFLFLPVNSVQAILPLLLHSYDPSSVAYRFTKDLARAHGHILIVPQFVSHHCAYRGDGLSYKVEKISTKNTHRTGDHPHPRIHKIQ